MRRIFAVAACVAAVAGLGASAAFAGEVTGNGRYIAGSDAAPLKGKSACAYSGVNDNYALGNIQTDESGNLIPDADGFTRTQSWGQVVRTAGPLGGAAFGCNPNRAEGEEPEDNVAAPAARRSRNLHHCAPCTTPRARRRRGLQTPRANA